MKNSSSTTQVMKAIESAKNGDNIVSRDILRQAVQEDPTNYRAWLWLAYTAEDMEEKRTALYHALSLDDSNEKVWEEFKRTYHPIFVQRAAKHGAFMCYSRADDLFAVELAELVKERELPVWIDMLDVPLDADWNAAVFEALEASGVVLVVLSPDLIDNEGSREEIEYSLQKGKIVLPLLHKDCDWQQFGFVHKPIDFRDKPASALRMVFALLGILNTR